MASPGPAFTVPARPVATSARGRRSPLERGQQGTGRWLLLSVAAACPRSPHGAPAGGHRAPGALGSHQGTIFSTGRGHTAPLLPWSQLSRHIPSPGSSAPAPTQRPGPHPAPKSGLQGRSRAWLVQHPGVLCHIPRAQAAPHKLWGTHTTTVSPVGCSRCVPACARRAHHRGGTQIYPRKRGLRQASCCDAKSPGPADE